ncbi:MAG TPA: hypothetical protein DGT53_03965 [Dialister sp.]|nr:hypothetical protein [Dialister sp.]
MKPLEDWRVNRGMTGSFLCWKFEGKKQSFKSRHFLWKGPSFGRTLPGRKQSVFPQQKQNFYIQTWALRHLRPCSDDEDRGLL